MVKTVYIDFPDDFKFPKYHDEQNITVQDVEEPYTESTCEDCPFDYDTVYCRLGGKRKCPFYGGGDHITRVVHEDRWFDLRGEYDTLCWHECHMEQDGMTLAGKCLPKDGTRNYWKFRDGTVLIARMKKDAQDHFWPPCEKSEEDIVAWAEIPKDTE